MAMRAVFEKENRGLVFRFDSTMLPIEVVLLLKTAPSGNNSHITIYTGTSRRACSGDASSSSVIPSRKNAITDTLV